ncbi:DUF4010 domain-containing protein [Geminicoccus flavidas]|uniref:DUF4010 domain-containing protein n=1 Tax=Geminicoccus flavidas TaxID=2506407 RepID=UPI00190FA692|nr:DUF4010 domain-containing protein [Geminicoccus flavidas]
MAAIIAAVMLLAKLVGDRFGETGLYGLAAVSGLADVDALTLSMARMAGSGIPLKVAAGAIAIAAAVNTVVKCVLGGAIGLWRLGVLVRSCWPRADHGAETRSSASICPSVALVRSQQRGPSIDGRRSYR